MECLTKASLTGLNLCQRRCYECRPQDNAGRLNDPNFVQEAGATLDFYYGITGSALGTGAYQSVQDVFGIQNSTGALSCGGGGS